MTNVGSLEDVHIYIHTYSVSGYLVYSKIDDIGTSIKCLLCDKQ